MRIVFVTQYYPPEVGAPQFRISDMARRMQAMGNTVTVLTAMPNYPQMIVHPAYRGKVYLKEELEGIPVIRSWIYANRNRSFASRITTYFSFVFSSLCIGIWLLPRADVLICESPPLFLGISAWFLSRAKGAKMVFNVSDLWPESAVKLGLVKNPFLIEIAEKLEGFLYRRSLLVTGQTKGICHTIEARFQGVHTYWWRNGIDVDLFDTNADKDLSRKRMNMSSADFVVLYAGILGHAQGLEMILEAACRPGMEQVKFLIVGDGPEKERLVNMALSMQIKNVVFRDVVSRPEMPAILAAADVSVVPLRKIDLFLGAIPSKIFESLIMAKPILLAVDGEARELFVEQGRCGLYVEPENVMDLVEKIRYLRDNHDVYARLSKNAREYVVRHFSRADIAAELFEKINHEFQSHDKGRN